MYKQFLTSTFVAIFTLMAAARTASAAAENYLIDPTHMSIVFSVSHSGLSYTYGFFREATGAYVLDDANPAANRFQLVIKTESLDTNNAKRDDHLRNPDFFDAKQYPDIVFQSTKCERVNSADQSVVYNLTGNLTMHGKTKEVSFPLRLLGKGKGPYGDSRTGFLCQIEIKRSDFGMSHLVQNNMVGDAVGITVSFEGVLQVPGATPQQTR